MATSADGPAGGAAEPGDGPLGADERAELLALRKRLPARRRWRAALSALLITLAAVLAPLSAVAVWVADEMADTDRYVATVAPLARHPDVRAAVTDRVTDAAMAKLDLDSLLSGVAPSDRPGLEKALGTLRGPITGGIRDVVRQTVARFVASDAFATLWEQLNRQAHAAFTGALTGDSDTAVKVNGDAVVLDLAPVVTQVKQRLLAQGLSAASLIPEVRTDFTLVKSEDVRRARTGFRWLQITGNWLPVVTVVLAAVGVLLAARRRRALVAAALGIAAGAAVLGIGLVIFRIIYLDHLPAGTNEAAAGAIYDQIVRFLRVTVRMLIVLGIVVAAGAWLSGSGRWAERVTTAWETGIAAVRQAVGIRTTGPVGPWVHRYRLALRWVVVGGAGLALLLWPYPTGLVVVWIAVVAVAVLAVIEFLDDRRQPDVARVTSA
ncbi:hypothetical protein [Actinacidiphila paucisporea]|uniref:Integral membrane protein n=1 Tax=Actinacidiphila paucisporea TaxID=310782 RepID=A0A1M7ETT7_9ACTN|nr:hypothetical protein [Actinacidiphila paucisporea]SHL95265.1 hypothetical protein SAMN05216499_10787 [Actinacidiphila paucisporea]